MSPVPLKVAEEVEGVQSTYGPESVLLHTEPDGQGTGGVCLEIEVRPRGEEANTLVWVTLLVNLPTGYPEEAVPSVDVYRSRGTNDAQVRAALTAAGDAIAAHGRQECGCLVPIVMQVASALASSFSECSICQEICKASDAIDAPCGDVFHESCLRDWADLRRLKRIAEADKVTEPIVKQLDVIRRDITQAQENEEVTRQAVQQQRLRVQEAEDWLVKAQRRARIAMGEELSDSEEEEDAEQKSEGSEEEGEESSDDSDAQGRVGRHQKIKFNNQGWGKGRKKNFQPSTSRNRGRAKKYLNQVEDIVEERREKAKAELVEKASPQIQAWQLANQDLKNAKALLDRARMDLSRDEKKTEDLQVDLKELDLSRQAQRDSIIKVTIPCPVCQNPLDPDGVIQQLRASQALQNDTKTDALRKRRAAEAAAGRVDIRLEVQQAGGSEASTALPKEAQRLLGVYVRDPEPSRGFPDGRPTYSGPKGSKLHFLQHPAGHWVVSLGRLQKFILKDPARTPDYACEESVWQAAASEGFCEVNGLRAVSVNSRMLAGYQDLPQQADLREARAAVPMQATPASVPSRPARTKKSAKVRRQPNLEELADLVAELVSSFADDEERLLEAVDELLGAVDEVELREALMSVVEEQLAQLAAAPRRRKAKARHAAA